jgi:hypothetical protein
VFRREGEGGGCKMPKVGRWPVRVSVGKLGWARLGHGVGCRLGLLAWFGWEVSLPFFIKTFSVIIFPVCLQNHFK